MTTSRSRMLLPSLALSLLLWPELASAQPAATAAASAANEPATRLFLWEVKSKTATVYLLGSVHVASADLYPLDARIERAFEGADTLVMETPLDASAQQQAAALLQGAGMYTPPDSLTAHLDKALMAQVEKAAGALGLPALAVQMMRPWLASLTLTILKLQSLGYKPDQGIDLHFHANAGKKRVAALETIEQQVALLRDLPEPTQVAALRQTLEQLPELSEVMRRTLGAWRRGEADVVDKLLIEPTRKEYPELYRSMFVDRNRRMAKEVERYLAGKGTTFVVVGAGHLVGRDSILKLLQASGHKPKQL